MLSATATPTQGCAPPFTAKGATTMVAGTAAAAAPRRSASRMIMGAMLAAPAGLTRGVAGVQWASARPVRAGSLTDHGHRSPARGRAGRALRQPQHRALPALQPRPGAGARRPPQLVHLQLRRAVDLDGPLHPDVHAGVGPDGQRHELEPGAVDHRAG